MPSPTTFRDDSEFIRPKPRKHPNQLTIQHWQLCDLLTCPGYSNEFMYVHGNNVLCYDTNTNKQAHVMKDLPFKPTCLAANYEYLAVGGRQSQVMVHQLNNNRVDCKIIGGSINNNICISQHSKGTRMLISNNDQTVKVFSLPDFQCIATILLPTAVNCAAVSPDGTKMVAVGDSNQVFLFDIDANGEYHQVGTYTASSDAGLSCSWNEYSTKFAVANQDGYISVWDVRYSEKLCKIPTKQHPQTKGAPRVVKFSQGGSVDLLMFSEHTSYIHVVNARSFNERQTLCVVPPDYDQHISGIAFSPSSKSIFVGTEQAVFEYEVDTMHRRSFASSSFL